MPEPRTTTRLEDHDYARLLPKYRQRARNTRRQSQTLRQAIQTAELADLRAHSDKRRTPPTPPGDAHKLRGIPAISKDGLGGHVPGTRPDQLANKLDRILGLDDAA